MFKIQRELRTLRERLSRLLSIPALDECSRLCLLRQIDSPKRLKLTSRTQTSAVHAQHRAEKRGGGSERLFQSRGQVIKRPIQVIKNIVLLISGKSIVATPAVF